jgi:hypothetical protein
MIARWSIFLALTACAQQLPMEPPHHSGQSITGAFEGWFPNPDGTFSLLLGYYNRNTQESMDIPVGAENHIDPDGPDYGQPTHFIPGRMWGVFTIRVPKNFGDKKLTWTIVANGKSTTIPVSLATDYEVSPFVDGTGNTPPYISLSEAGPFVNGPAGQTASMTATVGTPLNLAIWLADDAHTVPGMRKPPTPAVTVGWTKFRGPGEVTFAAEKPAVEKSEFQAPKTDFTGKATTNVTFSEEGEYILRVVANDWTGDGGRGFQCCWSNAMVKVSVKGSGSGTKN